ncbi:MAG: hypothetical protein JXR96_07630 [Deltaproteobacteria bacterium]|nr:hypothetical protein [Deltaproteobacteria bacterium]
MTVQTLLMLPAVLLGLTRVGITLHVAVDGGAPVASEQWTERIMKKTNELFEPAGCTFAIVRVTRFDDPGPEITRVSERHALARHAEPDGTIHLFVVARLADKERKGVWIAGVHWRYAGRKKAWRHRRYIILSQDAAGIDTPAHELGHYFGEGHARKPDNLMKRRPRDAGARFSKQQIGRIKRRLAREIRRKALRPIENEPKKKQVER